MMGGRLEPRQAAAPSTIPAGVWIAIGVAGGIILIALVCMIFLLVRATRSHKHLLADLEQRGIRLGQQNVRLEGNGVTKPRSVLRRNTFLPYNTTTGWGVLPSKESFGQSSITKLPQTSQTTTAPAESSNSSSPRRVWPFQRRSNRSSSSRSNAPKQIKLERIRTTRLSAILESPRTKVDISSPVAADGKESINRESTPTPRLTLDLPIDSPIERLCPPSFDSKPNSAPNLLALQPAPLFSSPTPSSGTVIRSPKRRVRSNSVPSDCTGNDRVKDTKPSGGSQKVGRNFSLVYRQSGLAPEDPVPPLPLRYGHTRSISNLDHSPSRRSASSFESATSSILVTTSPISSRSPQARLKQSPGHELRKSLVIKGPRPLRPLSSRPGHSAIIGRHCRDESIRSNVAQFSTIHTSSAPHSRNNSCDSGKSAKRKGESINYSRPSLRSKSNNSLSAGPPSTPRRNSRTLVTEEGSPTERRRSAIVADASGNVIVPVRQLSQSSTNASSSRSSDGNPFRWDPAPTQSGKSTAAMSSPERKRAHRRQNCIRLSANQEKAASPAKADSPTMMGGIMEETGSGNKNSLDEGSVICMDARPLPRPPSIGVFAPDIHLEPTTIRASLATGSPTLSLTKFNQDNPDSPKNWRHSGVSCGSVFSIPTFPSPTKPESPKGTFGLQPQADATSGADMDDAAATSEPQKQRQEHSMLRHPLRELSTPTPRPLSAEVRLSAPSSNEGSKPPEDSPPCSPKTRRFNTSLIDAAGPSPKEDVDEILPPAPEIPPKDPRRSEISPTRGGLTGPRAEPGRDLRKTVAALRRMNSDAAKDDSRTSRRYRQLGREATSNALGIEDDSASPTKDERRKSSGADKGRGFSKSPSQHFVPSSSYSLVSPASLGYSLPIAAPSYTNASGTPATNSFMSSAAGTTSTAPTSYVSGRPSSSGFGLGLTLGVGGNVGTGGLGPSTSSNSLVGSLLGLGSDYGENSCTSLTDLILAESESIFGPRRDLPEPPVGEKKNDSPGARVGAAARSGFYKKPHYNRVWEDGENFWESPCDREIEVAVGREREERERGRTRYREFRGDRERDDSPSVYSTPATTNRQRSVSATAVFRDEESLDFSGSGSGSAGAGSGIGGGGEEDATTTTVFGTARGSSEFFDSDAENKTPVRDREKEEDQQHCASGDKEGGSSPTKKSGGRRSVLAPLSSPLLPSSKTSTPVREREVLGPKVLISVQPPSEQGTPQSLYDRDGFLR